MKNTYFSFLQKFEVNPLQEDSCWIWKEGTSNGYGQFTIHGKHVRAHVASYHYHKGNTSPGLFVLHKCDNKLCVNPDHLFLGTHLENIQDMDSKGRRSCGIAHGFLSDYQVAEICRLYSEGNLNQYELAEKFQCSQPQISRIVRKESRTYVQTNN